MVKKLWALFKRLFRWWVPHGIFRSWERHRQRADGEVKVSYGTENPDKTFYVIGRNCKPDAGLMWIVLHDFSHMLYAESQGYIPVVDLQNNKSQFSQEIQGNVWESYFEQPRGYSIADIQRSANIILCRTKATVSEYATGDREYDLMYRKRFRELIRLNPETKAYIDEDYRRILSGKGDVLGVLCRGTDYLLNQPVQHYVQPRPEEVVEKAKEVLSRKGWSYLYLATEDQEIFELFKMEFGERLLANSQVRYRRKDFAGGVQRIADLKLARRDRDRYWTNLEYLSSIHLLSRCRSFMGGRTGGTKGVFYFGGDFEEEYVWDIGKYR